MDALDASSHGLHTVGGQRGGSDLGEHNVLCELGCDCPFLKEKRKAVDIRCDDKKVRFPTWKVSL
jgi:hypothetical protein